MVGDNFTVAHRKKQKKIIWPAIFSAWKTQHLFLSVCKDGTAKMIIAFNHF